ncbi:MAG: orotate phosphoribosyltransferase [Clostridia bacterium]|nr:orotate phosphoribosyltransferase [Clostridia bacterium]MBR6741156.1 orotate phosphoribosyltransferase [Clostridia bacterium]
MPTPNKMKFATKRNNLNLRVAAGHFATGNRHSNYYIDVVTQKTRLSEAKAVAEELRSYYYADTIVDTILCIDGTEVIGTCLAESLTKADFINMNAHKTIYVVTPEIVNGSQIVFRDNIVPMIKDKHVMILAVSVASGKTVETAVDAVKYYGGMISGIASIFSTKEECSGYPVRSVFNPNDIPGYESYPAHECPLCKEGKKIDALINSHGFSKL